MKKILIFTATNIGIAVITFVTTSVIDFIGKKSIGSKFIEVINYKFELWIYIVISSGMVLAGMIYSILVNRKRNKNRRKEFVAEKLTSLADYLLLNKWTDFIDNALRGFVAQEFVDNQKKINSLYLSTLWPNEYTKIKLLIKQIVDDYNDYLQKYLEHAEPVNDVFFREIKFYKSDGWNGNYNNDLQKYKDWSQEWYDRLHQYVYHINELVIHLSNKFDEKILPETLKRKYLLEDDMGVYNEMRPSIMLPGKRKGI